MPERTGGGMGWAGMGWDGRDGGGGMGWESEGLGMSWLPGYHPVIISYNTLVA